MSTKKGGAKLCHQIVTTPQCTCNGRHPSSRCGSEEIEWAGENDVSVRYLCAKTWPDAETIRRFRRANRPWIGACLARVYGSACPPKETSANLRAFLQRKIEVAIKTDTVITDGY